MSSKTRIFSSHLHFTHVSSERCGRHPQRPTHHRGIKTFLSRFERSRYLQTCRLTPRNPWWGISVAKQVSRRVVGYRGWSPRNNFVFCARASGQFSANIGDTSGWKCRTSGKRLMFSVFPGDFTTRRERVAEILVKIAVRLWTISNRPRVRSFFRLFLLRCFSK